MATRGLRRRGARRVGLAAGAVMAVSQIAVPFTGASPALTTVVVAAFATTTTALVARIWGWERAALAAVAIVAATALLEWVGTSTGLPFGEYRYTGALRPTIAGVPLAVTLAWLAMALPAREVAARLAPQGWQRVIVGAVALTAWDVMLDPQMVAAGYWVWEDGGPWRGIPLSNYAGWLVSSAGIMVLADLLLPRPGGSRPLLALYTWWAVMQTLGFLLFFGDPVVGVVGGLLMLPLAGLAWRADLGTWRYILRPVARLAGARRG